jgi:WD40 repeat protein
MALLPQKYTVNLLCFSSDGKFLITCAFATRDITIWNLAKRKIERTIDFDTFLLNKIEFTPQGKILGTGQGMIVHWDLDGKSIEHRIHSYDVCLSPSEKHLVYLSHTGDLMLYDMEKGKTVGRVDAEVVHVFGLTYSPDGKYLIFGTENVVKVFETGYYTLQYEFQPVRKIKTLQVSPCSQFVLAISEKHIEVWDMVRKKRKITLFVKTNSVSWAPDSTHFASVGNDGKIKIWNVFQN